MMMAQQPVLPTTSAIEKCGARLSVRRPSLTPLKRKHSDDESTSPTSLDELINAANVDDLVISPKKKAKCRQENIQSKLDRSIMISASSEAMDEEDPCMKVLAAYVPNPIDSAPTKPFDEAEMEMLEYFLA